MAAPQDQVDALAAYVNAQPGDDYVAECATTAHTLVARAVGNHDVPADVQHMARLEVGANLFNRRASTRDSATALDVDTTPGFFRPALDPLTPAWPILRPYIGMGIV